MVSRYAWECMKIQINIDLSQHPADKIDITSTPEPDRSISDVDKQARFFGCHSNVCVVQYFYRKYP